LKCEYNKDGDSYRSPWTNQYYPPIEVGADEEDYEPIYPSSELLEMEMKANEVFGRYAHSYYDSNYHTSVYFFDTDDNGFGSCWLVKKSIAYEGADRDSTWDAIHVVKTNVDANQKARYKVNSSVFLMMETSNAQQGTVDVAGNVTRLKEDYVAIDPKQDVQTFHLKSIGRLIEQNESEIRSEMYGIFINKSK